MKKTPLSPKSPAWLEQFWDDQYTFLHMATRNYITAMTELGEIDERCAAEDALEIVQVVVSSRLSANASTRKHKKKAGKKIK